MLENRSDWVSTPSAPGDDSPRSSRRAFLLAVQGALAAVLGCGRTPAPPSRMLSTSLADLPEQEKLAIKKWLYEGSPHMSGVGLSRIPDKPPSADAIPIPGNLIDSAKQLLAEEEKVHKGLDFLGVTDEQAVLITRGKAKAYEKGLLDYEKQCPDTFFLGAIEQGKVQGFKKLTILSTETYSDGGSHHLAALDDPAFVQAYPEFQDRDIWRLKIDDILRGRQKQDLILLKETLRTIDANPKASFLILKAHRRGDYLNGKTMKRVADWASGI